MASRSVHFIVEGRVQGVFFRAYTKEKADELGLCGWVRNLVDGRVEGYIEGPENKIAAMLEWLSAGSPHSIVRRVSSQEVKAMQCDDRFEITTSSASPFDAADFGE
jgi:acylphosphatase